MTQHIRLTARGSTLLIEMVQERSRNAMTAQMKAELADALVEASAPDVRAVIITGAGDVFCAGGDVKAMQKAPVPGDTHESMRRLHETIVRPFMLLAKPTIAAVNGVAAGAGVGIALACDFRVVSDRADFVFAFNRLGLVPDFALSYNLPRLVGLARAKELAMVKGRLTAEEADRWGLVTEMSEHGQVLERATELAARLAAGPTAALALTKHMLDVNASADLDDALRLEAASQSEAVLTHDHQVARDAFLQRSGAPTFAGR